jgi:hypothetical protein
MNELILLTQAGLSSGFNRLTKGRSKEERRYAVRQPQHDYAYRNPKIKRHVTKLWDDLAFQRVFLNETDAMTWWMHHQHLGPPSQPFHIEPYLLRSRMRAECHIQDDADFLLAAKVLAQAAVAKGECMAAVELGR